MKKLFLILALMSSLQAPAITDYVGKHIDHWINYLAGTMSVICQKTNDTCFSIIETDRGTYVCFNVIVYNNGDKSDPLFDFDAEMNLPVQYDLGDSYEYQFTLLP